MKVGNSVHNHVVIAADSDEEFAEIERALLETGSSVKFSVSSLSAQPRLSAFSFAKHTALIFTRVAIEKLSIESVALIRSATESASCRIFLADADGLPHGDHETQLDDLIQRTPNNYPAGIATLVVDFFNEADDLWRTSNLRGIRDAVCISAYGVLGLVWPLSYFYAALLLFHAAASLIFKRPLPWQFLVDSSLVSATLIFAGTFFCVHALYTTTRNLLLIARIGEATSLFFLPAAVLGLATAAVIASIWTLGKSVVYSMVALLLSIVIYRFYLYVLRIRVECTSLSFLQREMADPASRRQIAEEFGNELLTPNAFSLFKSREPRSIFISYMHKSDWSAQTARQLDQDWKERGTKVFLDRSTIPSAAAWRQHLLRAISECTDFIAILDHHTPESDWVLAESAYAAMLRKNIGKPNLLVIVRDREGIEGIRKCTFGLVYRDLFDNAPSKSYGALLYAATDTPRISAETVESQLRKIQPTDRMIDLGLARLLRRFIILR